MAAIHQQELGCDDGLEGVPEADLASMETSSNKSLIAKFSHDVKQKRNLDDVLSEIPLGQFHWRMLILVGGGYFAVCSEMMLFIFLSSPVKKEWNLHHLDFPWLPFCTGITGITGGYFAGIISDKYGRRLPFLVGMLFLATFGVVSSFAPTFPVFVILRCMVTIGIGVFEAVGFVLLLEFLPRQRRGTVLVVVTLCGALGAVFAGGFAWLVLPNWGWRWFVGICAVPSFFVLLLESLAFFESPRYLFVSGKQKEAFKVLQEMAKINKCDPPLLDGIECSTQSEPRGYLRKLFSKELLSKTALLSCIWLLQATGYWGTTTYLPEYMDKLGVDSHLNMFSVFIGEIPGLLLAMFLIEKQQCGRVGCLRIFSALTGLSLLVFAFIPKHVLKTILIVMCFFSMVPIYSILNTFTPEAYPTHLRSTAMAWMNMLIEIPGLVTPFIGATLLSSDLPWLYPVVWGLVFVLLFILTFGIRFETRGRNLLELSSSNTHHLSTDSERENGDLRI